MLLTIVSTLLCLAMIPLLGKKAIAIGLTDKPDARKRHDGEVPLVGGLAIFLTLVCVQLFSAGSLMSPVLLLLCLVLVVLGVVDDVRDLSARCRLCFQLGVSLLMVLIGDVRIESVGALFGGEPVQFSYGASVLFTVICTVGVINAINMIDGMDGLSGSLLSVTFFAMALLAFLHGDASTALALSVVAGCLLAFLYFNARVVRDKARVFLGDAGSMMLGLVLVWYLVEMTQGIDPALSPVAAGWLFGLPLMDTVAVMMGRIVEKRSPFEAGRDHLHHRLRRRQLSVNATVGLMLAMHSTLVLVGVVNAQAPENEAGLFWGFVLLVVLQFGIYRRYFKASEDSVLTD